LSSDGRAISSAGRLGGFTQEFVIAAEGVFRNFELGHGRKPRWGPQAVVITQGAEADVAVAELSAQVALHTGQIVRPGAIWRASTITLAASSGGWAANSWPRAITGS
jgi:hypothetical protein